MTQLVVRRREGNRIAGLLPDNPAAQGDQIAGVSKNTLRAKVFYESKHLPDGHGTGIEIAL